MYDEDQAQAFARFFAERMYDPLLKLMDDRAFDWGIITDVEAEMGLDIVEEKEKEEVPSWDSMLHSGWDVVEVMPGYYSTRNLDDAEFEGLMTWLYSTGWDVSCQSRTLNIISCHHCGTDYSARQWSWAELDEVAATATAAPEERYAVPKNACTKCGTYHWSSKTPCPTGAGAAPAPVPVAPLAPAVPEERYAVPKNACGKCGTHHWSSKTPCPTGAAKALSKPGTDIGLRDGAPVPRFCNLGRACPKAGCRYVHGDTIPRINAMCRFDSTCQGEKRANCIHMHTGEKYVKGMVLVRR